MTGGLLWDPRPPGSRGPKPQLTREKIVETAIAVADADGLAAVSMQQVADRLGFTKMSLYRHVPGKADLLALMTDRAIGEPPELAGVPGGWRPRLEFWCHRMAEMLDAHPWLLDNILCPRVWGPCELGWIDRALAELAGTGLTGAERMDAVATLTAHLRSVVQQGRDSATPEADFADTLGGLMAAHGERFPALAAAVAESTADGLDNALDFGLQRILDGLGALIIQRVAGTAG